MGMVVSVLAERPASLMGSRPPPAVPTPIVFDRVSFRYAGTYGDAVRELSFRWEGETVIALAGANGSGKSTCLRLLLGLARPQGGDVTVGGVSLVTNYREEFNNAIRDSGVDGLIKTLVAKNKG